MRPFAGMNAQNTALLIVDVVNSCSHEACEIPEWDIYFSRIRAMALRLDAFLGEYRRIIGSAVVFGKTVPWRREFLADNVNELYEDARFAYYARDASGFAEEIYLMRPQAGDLVFDKNTNDALANPQLREELDRRCIRYLITTGVFTDGCVLATVVGGFSRGYSFVVLRDLVETTDSETRQAIQRHLLDYTFPYLFARVITSGELLAGWGEGPPWDVESWGV